MLTHYRPKCESDAAKKFKLTITKVELLTDSEIQFIIKSKNIIDNGDKNLK
jgi:hypothetical protein